MSTDCRTSTEKSWLFLLIYNFANRPIPRTERMKYIHKGRISITYCSIQMKRKELTTTFMKILNGKKPFGLLVYITLFQRFKGYYLLVACYSASTLRHILRH